MLRRGDVADEIRMRLWCRIGEFDWTEEEVGNLLLIASNSGIRFNRDEQATDVMYAGRTKQNRLQKRVTSFVCRRFNLL